MDKEMQKEFEETYIKVLEYREFVPDYLFNKDDFGGYTDSDVSSAYFWWCKSREVMKPICLPMWCTVGEDSDKYLLKYEVIDTIQQAGYEV